MHATRRDGDSALTFYDTPCVDASQEARVGGTVAMEPAMPRVLFVNRSYWPDVEATGQLLTQLCEDLAGEFDVSVLAGQPNQNIRQEGFRSVGSEQHRGVTIHRVQHTRFPKRSFAGRLINLVSFFAAAWRHGRRIERPDVLVVESDPFLLPLLGRSWRRRHRCRFVVYLQDVYPDVAVALGKVREGWFTGWLRRRLIQAYCEADRVIVLSEDMKRRLANHGVPEERMVILPNWADAEAVIPLKEDNAFRQRHGWQDRFVVMYSGNMGLCQNLQSVLELADRVRDREDVVFVLIGDGAARQDLQQEAKQRKLTNVHFLPYQPRETLSESLSAGDLHLVPLDARATGCIMPSKLYGVMASGSAVLAIAEEDSDLHRLVSEEQIGVAAPQDDLTALEQSVLWCADHRDELMVMGKRARQLAEQVYDRPLAVRRFAKLLHQVLGHVSDPVEPAAPSVPLTPAAVSSHR